MRSPSQRVEKCSDPSRGKPWRREEEGGRDRACERDGIQREGRRGGGGGLGDKANG